MTIKERVLASLKTSYAKYGFKKDELNSLTDIISANLTNESSDDDVTAAVTNAEGYARMMQTVYNRGISETNKKYEGYVPKPQDPPAPQTPPATQTPSPSDDGKLTMEQVQKMINEATANNQKAIKDAVEAATAPFLQEQEKSRLAGMLQNHEKLKSIPARFREKYTLDKEENLETVANQIEADYTALKQELVSSGQFVEAPSQSSPESDADDFVKRMEDYGKRNAQNQEPTQR